MADDFEFDVFLSYSPLDKPAVRDLAERLKARGLRVWFDEWEIQPGKRISRKVEQGLRRSRALILVMSKNAFGSDWVTLARQSAHFRDPTNAGRRFIPLQLDDAEPNDLLRPFQSVDWRKRTKNRLRRW